MVKQSDYIPAVIAVALVVVHALCTRPTTPAPSAAGTRTLPATHPSISRIYDVRELLEQADAFSIYLASLLTDEQHAYTIQADKAGCNPGAIRNLLCIQPDAEVGPVIDGRVCVVASERTHAQIEYLLHTLRQQEVTPTEIKP